MYICKFCQREGKTHKSNWIHQSRCKLNPERYIQPIWNAGKTGLQVAWNKGRTDLPTWFHSDETKQRLSQSAKERGLGGYIPGSGRGKKGWYKGIHCDSSWELAYVIYCFDHKIDIKRNTDRRKYIWNGVTKNYMPDFIVGGKVVEIKGYKTDQWIAKLDANPDIEVLYEEDLQPILKYVILTYGKDFIKLYGS